MAVLMHSFISILFFFQPNLEQPHTTIEQTNSNQSFSFQQNSESDTLLAAEKLDTSIALFKKSKFKEALSIGQEALQIAGDFNGKIKGDIYANIGRCHLRIQNLDQAINSFEKAGHIYQQTKPIPHISIAYNFSNIGICYKSKENYQQALTYYQKAIDYSDQTIGTPQEGIGNAYMNKGNIFRRLGQYENAIENFEKALSIYEEVLEHPHIRFGIVSLNLGLTYENIKELEKAERYNQKALNSFLATVGSKHYYTYTLYHNIGIIFKEKGDYIKALDYEHKALALGREMFENDPAIGDIYNMMGSIYREMGAYEKGLEHYQKGLYFKLEHHPKNHLSMTSSYRGLGLTHGSMGQYDIAIGYFKKIIKIEKEQIGDNFADLDYSYSSMARFYQEKGSTQKALEYYQKGLEIATHHFGKKHPRAAFIFTFLGEFYLKQKQWEKALHYLDRAAAGFGISDVINEKWPDVSSYSYATRICQGNGTALEAMYAKDKNLTTLNKAIKNWENGIAFLEQFRWSLESTKAKNFLTTETYSIYEGAIRSNLLAFEQSNDEIYLARIFDAFEKSKNFILLQTLSDLKAKQFSGISQQELEKEKTLKTTISWLEEQRKEAGENKEENANQIDSLSELIFHKKEGLSKLIASFEKNNPKYFDLKYGAQYTTLADFQKGLQDEHAFIEYFVGDLFIYILVVSKKEKKVIAIPKDFPLEAWIKELNKSITNYPTAHERSEAEYLKSQQVYKEKAFQLYEKLISPIGILPLKTTIIPDDVLWNIPFEILIKSKKQKQFRTLPYLIIDHEITYNFSATIWQEMKKSTYPNKKVLAFAPSFSEGLTSGNRSNSFKALDFNKTEAESITRTVGGKLMANKDATLQAFLDKSNKYALLHLATHVLLDKDNSENSYLAFTPSDSAEWKLYIRDLYNQYLPSEMVVLSACESGAGELQKGEGLISLSRGFAYAGAKSMITSLWQVNDQATANIMADFYKYLKTGKSKDTALREAKLNYLKNQKEDHLASPFYWGAFVAYGDMKPIDFTSGERWYLWLGLTALLMTLFVFIKKRFS